METSSSTPDPFDSAPWAPAKTAPSHLSDDLIERIGHPSYLAHYRDWLEYRAAYEGGRAYRESEYGLRPFTKQESGERLADRRARSYRVNLSRAIVDTRSSAVYSLRDQIVRECEAHQEEFAEIVADQDGKGTGADSYWEARVRELQIYGCAYSAVDQDRLPAQTVSQAEAARIRPRPYCYPVSPLHLISWEVDRSGAYLRALIWERAYRTPRLKTAEYQDRLIEWDLEQVRVHVVGTSGLMEDAAPPQPNPYGFVPLVGLWRGESGIVSSDLREIVALDRGVFELMSSAHQILIVQGFSQLKAMGIPIERIGEWRQAIGGVGFVLPLPPGADADYISPDARQVEVNRSQCEWLAQEAYRVASLKSQGASLEGSQTSGMAHAYEFQDTEVALLSLANAAEAAETRTWRQLSQILGWGEWTGTIDYPDSYQLQAVQDRVRQAAILLSLGLGRGFERIQRTRLAIEALPRLTDEERTEVLSAIDEEADLRAEVSLAGLGYGEEEATP